MKSFKNVRDWALDLDRYTPDYMPRMLIAAKCDLVEKRVVSFDMGLELATSLGFHFMETSARENLNVDEMYHAMVRLVMDRWIESAPPRPPPTKQKQKGRLFKKKAK